MEERFPSWVPVLSVALLSGALGWWLGQREGKILAATAGLRIRSRSSRVRTGEDRYLLGEGDGGGSNVTYSQSADEGQQGAANVSESYSVTEDPSKGADGESASVSLGPEGDARGADGSSSAPSAPSDLRSSETYQQKLSSGPRVRRQGAPLAIASDPPKSRPKLTLQSTETAEAQSYPSSTPSTMTPVTETSMPLGSGRPRVAPLRSAAPVAQKIVNASRPAIR